VQLFLQNFNKNLDNAACSASPAAAQFATTPDSHANGIFRHRTCSCPSLLDHTEHPCAALLAQRAADLLCTACARYGREARNSGNMTCVRRVRMNMPVWIPRFYSHGHAVPEIHILSL